MPVPVCSIHRRLWRTFWRRCSCGLPAPCVDRPVSVPVPPLPHRLDVPAKPPGLRAADHVAWGAGARDAAALPAPALGQGLRVSVAGHAGARRRRGAAVVLPTAEQASSNSCIPSPHIPPGSMPGPAATPASRHSDSVPTTRRARRPTRPRGWGSEVGRAGALTPAQHHRTDGGVRGDGRGVE